MTGTTFLTQDPDFDVRVRASFARQQVMATLGIEISQLSSGAIELTMPYAAAYHRDGPVCAISHRLRDCGLHCRLRCPELGGDGFDAGLHRQGYIAGV